MKGRESGMPEEAYWATFFDPPRVVEEMGCAESRLGLVEFGCGYGHFTLPAARLAKGPVFALDIEPEMTTTTARKARAAGLDGIRVELRDFVAHGTGRPDASVDYVMLFNILHIEDPVGLLREARRILAPGGKVGVIHWRSDVKTPRGPSLSIRPQPEQCRTWGETAGLSFSRDQSLSSCPYHYGLILERLA